MTRVETLVWRNIHSLLPSTHKYPPTLKIKTKCQIASSAFLFGSSSCPCLLCFWVCWKPGLFLPPRLLQLPLSTLWWQSVSISPGHLLMLAVGWGAYLAYQWGLWLPSSPCISVPLPSSGPSWLAYSACYPTLFEPRDWAALPPADLPYKWENEWMNKKMKLHFRLQSFNHYGQMSWKEAQFCIKNLELRFYLNDFWLQYLGRSF